MLCDKYVEQFACAIILYPDYIEFGTVWGDLDPKLRQRDINFGSDAVDIESDVVVVGVEVLLHGVQFDGDDLVGGVAVGGGVGETEVLAVAVSREVERRGNHEGHAFTGNGVVDAEDVEEEGSVEGSDLSVGFPEFERLTVEDSAGGVSEVDVAGGVRSHLEGSEVD